MERRVVVARRRRSIKCSQSPDISGILYCRWNTSWLSHCHDNQRDSDFVNGKKDTHNHVQRRLGLVAARHCQCQRMESNIRHDHSTRAMRESGIRPKKLEATGTVQTGREDMED